MNIGKLTSVYLTPEEDAALRAYCNKHGCTPHSVIKAGLHWMLEEINKQDTIEPSRKAQDEKPTEARKKQGLAEILKALRETERKE